jgi:nucleoside recognition membrane protein YjiH
MMFERKSDALLPFPKFAMRVLCALLIALGVVTIALTGGTVGYHWLGRLPWVDALMNASMILTGMGPVATMETTGAKLFASGYALFSGIVFLSSVGLVFAPIFHRILHRFHLDDAPPASEDKRPRRPKARGKE